MGRGRVQEGREKGRGRGGREWEGAGSGGER